jgi:hypothetical protein
MRLSSRLALVGAVCVAVLPFGPAATASDDLIREDLTPSLPTDARINGVAPGGAPWVIDRGEVRVRDNGRVDVRIEGLQIPRADGTEDNPVASINAVLYCEGVQAADSGPQPLTVPEGDARFRVTVAVPDECEDAVVLISPTAAVGRAFIASAVAS